MRMYVLKKNQIVVTALVVMIVIAGYLNFSDRLNNNDQMAINAGMLDDEFTFNDATKSELVPNEVIETNKDSEATDAKDDKKAEVLKSEGQETKTKEATPKADDKALTEEKKEDAKEEVKEDKSAKKEDATTEDSKQDKAEATKSEDEPGTAVFVNAAAGINTYFAEVKLDREQARAKVEEKLTNMINNNDFPKEQKAEAAKSIFDITKRIEQETTAEAMIEAKGFNEAFVRVGDGIIDVVVDKAELTEAESAQIEDIVRRTTNMSADKIKIYPLKIKN